MKALVDDSLLYVQLDEWIFIREIILTSGWRQGLIRFNTVVRDFLAFEFFPFSYSYSNYCLAIDLSLSLVLVFSLVIGLCCAMTTKTRAHVNTRLTTVKYEQ